MTAPNTDLMIYTPSSQKRKKSERVLFLDQSQALRTKCWDGRRSSSNVVGHSQQYLSKWLAVHREPWTHWSVVWAAHTSHIIGSAPVFYSVLPLMCCFQTAQPKAETKKTEKKNEQEWPVFTKDASQVRTNDKAHIYSHRVLSINFLPSRIPEAQQPSFSVPSVQAVSMSAEMAHWIHKPHLISLANGCSATPLALFLRLF